MSAPSNADREPSHTSIPWVYLSNVTFLLSGGLFYVYLARVLPFDEIGPVVILAAIAALMSVAFSLGLGPGFQHFLSYCLGRSKLSTLRALVRSAFLVAGLLSLASVAATLLLSTELSHLFFHSGTYTTAIGLLALFAGLGTANSILQSVLVGLQRFATYSAVSITGYVATYGLAIVLLSTRPGVDSIVIGWTLGAALACGLYVGAILRHAPPVATEPTVGSPHGAASGLYRSVLFYSLPLFVSMVISTGALYVDRLVLASIADLASVGVYNYALLLASGSLLVVGPFATLLVPKISEFFGRGDLEAIRDLARTSTTLSVLLYVPVGLGIAAIGPFLLRFLAGPGFVPASLPMAVLLVVSAVFIPYAVLSSLAAGTRRTLVFAKAAGLALIANIALSVALVPRFGMVGAALGNSSMVWVPFVVLYIELRRTGLLLFDQRSIGRIWLASGAMFVAVGVPLELLGYDPVLVPVFAVLGVGVLFVSLRLLRAVTNDTATVLVRALPGWLYGLRPTVCWVGACRGCGHGSDRPRPGRPFRGS